MGPHMAGSGQVRPVPLTSTPSGTRNETFEHVTRTSARLGVSPTSPGYQTWLVQPHPGTLSWAEGQAPTPHGPVTVDWGHQAAGGEFALRVSAPPGTSG